VNKAFTPRVVAGLEGRIRALSAELLGRVRGLGEMDLAADYAVRLPTMVISELLGIPKEDWETCARWNEVLVNISHAFAGTAEARTAHQAFVAATGEMGTYLDGILKSPGDGLLTRLRDAEIDGERLTRDEVLGFFQLLLLAGSETTTHLILNAIVCLTDHPGEFERLRANPGLLPTAIEEVLRYRSPVQWMYRKVVRDVELGGQVVPAGAFVLAVMGAANRDPKVFAEAGRFDVGRQVNPHVAFGHGGHFCMGAALARMEGRIAMEDLLGLRELRRADEAPWKPRKGLHVHGPESLRVVFG
jgi:cytochrome P450